jgi:hypothetical protein
MAAMSPVVRELRRLLVDFNPSVQTVASREAARRRRDAWILIRRIPEGYAGFPARYLEPEEPEFGQDMADRINDIFGYPAARPENKRLYIWRSRLTQILRL